MIYNISQTEKDRYYQHKIKGKYGAPLLKDNERRLRAHMCKKAAQIRLSLNFGQWGNYLIHTYKSV